MSKIDDYHQTLKELDNWIPFLRKNSGLPGPRGNLELAHAVAELGSKKRFKELLSFQAEENTPEVFLVFCGVMGLGKLAANEPKLFDQLREYASDPRWRIREAVATGLQLVGDQDMDLLLKEMQKWSKGNWYEKRAAAAALAEPRLLRQPKYAKEAWQVLDEITGSMEGMGEPKEESFKVLRQAMGYCWSVVVAALPEMGKPRMEKWLDSQNKDIHWMMRENLKKNRLLKMDADWVKACNEKLEQAS
ncbi:MAG TPA: HEAT repeat domain-containing protein [Anaerolineales bacterium]